MSVKIHSKTIINSNNDRPPINRIWSTNENNQLSNMVTKATILTAEA